MIPNTKNCPWMKNKCKGPQCGVWSEEHNMCGIPAVAKALGSTHCKDGTCSVDALKK